MDGPYKNDNIINLSDRRNANDGKREAPKPPAFINVPKAVLASIAVLVAIHVVLFVLGPNAQTHALYALSFIPARLVTDLGIPHLPGAQFWTSLTYSLLHGDIMHLGFNILWLLIFGTPVARRFSTNRFLLILAAGSIGGALATLLFHWGEPAILIGASASVSGLMAAAVPIMYGQGSLLSRTATQERARNARVLPFRELLENRQALGFMVMFLGLTLFTGAAQLIDPTALLNQTNIAWEAHLGGFIAGLAAFYWLDN